MSNFELTVMDALDVQVPLRLDRLPAWDDVLQRARLHEVAPAPARARWRPRTRRFVFALAAAVLAVVLVGSALAALGQDPFGSLTSWLGGSPGTPAPADAQAGFAERNGASYASFPSRTRLRLLTHASAGGKGYSLLGFRNGHSLCLRLIASASPASRGVNQCVTLRELRRSAAPALVVSTASFHLAGHEVNGIFGFADDTVRALRIAYSLGERQSVPMRSNVFLALRGGPATAMYDPMVQIRALTRSGRAVTVPFTLEDVVPVPTTPSYLRRTRVVLPGPRKVQATLSSPTIGWIDRQEPRGKSFEPNLRGFESDSTQAVYARRVQPDPDDPYRIGIWVVRMGALGPHRTVGFGPVWGETFRLRTGQQLLCHAGLFPLRPAPSGYLCSPSVSSSTLFEPGHVVTIDRTYREAFTRVAGLAADGVREVDLYLASGRMIPAALRDNAYTVEGPSDQWPAKLVAYDAKGRVVEVDVIDPQGSKAVLTPCPPAMPTSGTASGAPRPWERMDLGSWTVAGRRILGRTRAQVERALGTPDAILGNELVYGLPASGSPLTISFAQTRSGRRAVWLEYRDPNVVDARLGRVLLLQPPALQRDLARAYPGLARTFGYGSEPALLGCTGVRRSADGTRELSFGLDPSDPSHPFVRLSSPAAAKER